MTWKQTLPTVALGMAVMCGAAWSEEEASTDHGKGKPAAAASEGQPAQPSGATDEAAEPPGEGAGRPLRMDFTIYTWLSSLRSEVTTDYLESSNEANFGDILEALDFANFAHLEVKKGNWGLFSEFDFIKMSNDGEFRAPRRDWPFKIHADGVMKETMIELGAMRSFEGRRLSLDALLGGRYFRLESDLNVGRIESNINKDWVDPLVGARLRLRLSDKWHASLRGDLAGFGAGSELTTNIVGAIACDISERYALGFGYRYLDIDQESDTAQVSTTTYGPIVGVTIRF